MLDKCSYIRFHVGPPFISPFEQRSRRRLGERRRGMSGCPFGWRFLSESDIGPLRMVDRFFNDFSEAEALQLVFCTWGCSANYCKDGADVLISIDSFKHWVWIVSSCFVSRLQSVEPLRSSGADGDVRKCWRLFWTIQLKRAPVLETIYKN